VRSQRPFLFDRWWTIAALVLLIVLVPTTCVVWFMNVTMASQAAAARQEVVDAYRDQLRVIRNRIHGRWTDAAKDLDKVPRERPPKEIFDTLVSSRVADSVIVLDPVGRVLYPIPRGSEAPWVEGGDPLTMAASVIMTDGTRPPAGLTRSRVPDVWQLPSESGGVIGLFSEETVHTSMHRVIDEHQTDMVHFALFPPDEGAYDEAIAVGTGLPGWQASFTLLDDEALGATARARATFFFWAGVISIASIALVGILVGHAFRRQARLARLKTDLVAAVSHELRTPLASMRLLVDGLLRDDEIQPQKTREYLELIATENGRLSRLIENFLTFSRLERNRQHFTFTTTEPVDVVQSAVAAMRERLYPGCVINVDVAPDLPVLHADPDALVSALLNLLDNAYKYTPGEKRIGVRVFRDEGEVVFTVEDNGIGIPLGEQKRIFRRFYRVDRRLARETSGVGLGLAIVHDVVHAHRGSIRVDSRAGEGSTFSMRLPYLQEATA
jgi:signal transduction histidine kinase